MVWYLRGRDVVEVAANRLGLDGAAFLLHRVNWRKGNVGWVTVFCFKEKLKFISGGLCGGG